MTDLAKNLIFACITAILLTSPLNAQLTFDGSTILGTYHLEVPGESPKTDNNSAVPNSDLLSGALGQSSIILATAIDHGTAKPGPAVAGEAVRTLGGARADKSKSQGTVACFYNVGAEGFTGNVSIAARWHFSHPTPLQTLQVDSQVFKANGVNYPRQTANIPFPQQSSNGNELIIGTVPFSSLEQGDRVEIKLIQRLEMPRGKTAESSARVIIP